MKVTVVNTSTANLASVLAGLQRAGAEATVSDEVDTIARAQRLVLPGVGSFGAGMDRLSQLGLTQVLRQAALEGRPLLCVCLGLQLLCQGSEESPGVPGLGVIEAQVSRFEASPEQSLCIPQLGWNRVTPDSSCQLLQPGYAYYANSYRIASAPPGCAAATTNHGQPFVAAVERGPLLACQFHPELSGAWGQELLERWLQTGASC